MKAIFSKLMFDKELVSNLKQSHTPESVLYQNLISGRITMQEYLAAL